MDLISSFNVKATQILIPAITNSSSFSASPRNSKFPVPNKSCTVHARKRNSNSNSDSLPQKNLVEEVLLDEEEDVLFEDFEDEEVMDGDGGGDYFEDEYAEEDSEIYAGDGGEGGGISLAGTWWDKEALAIAEDVCLSFDGVLKIYAFKTTLNCIIRVRIENMSKK
ncbi:hypothetical protein Patl1_08139 [Pistacia atlantica]|uniref:Uncharacterized protein n=1 Tax=Pistacia atlantica TaxID=434234 RepID=A0ACC1AH15_9ROSI|nr:hypothetical protein Patl1_08139 [Pistacia atlantica]